MALECLVKISSVNNLSDARYVAGMGVGLMGFDLDPCSENFVDPEKFSAIISWISGVEIVGELGSVNDVDAVNKVLGQYQVDYLQVNAETARTGLEELSLPVMVKICQPDKVHITSVFDKFKDFPCWYLLETDIPMSEEVLQWCTSNVRQYPLILGSNLSAENVHEFLQSGFRGISLRGGQEIRPGYRNFDELADILEALEIID